ncbi:MAG: hypothetical protein KJ578_03195 [Bacteroidetes bacterium]|nr:hypothetical protein [Bacteroidota bacterium]MBU1579769.1 hypothetical protein [Bacteroidota bacterium]MBU2556769.1 hypothetical protein [Bacteroidota bacterium]
MKHLKNVLLVFCLGIFITGFAQIGIGTNFPAASAALDIYSLSKGFLLPRISLTGDLTNPTPVVSPAVGLIVFNVSTQQEIGFYYWSGSQWIKLSDSTTTYLTSTGPANDNAVARFQGTTGNEIQNSSVSLTDDGSLTGINQLATNTIQISSSPSSGHQLVTDNTGLGSWQSKPPVDVHLNGQLVLANAKSLNFTGGIHVENNTENKATVKIFNNNVTGNIMQLSSPDAYNLNTDSPTPLEWKTEHYKDEASFAHSNTENPSRIYVKSDGIYEINFLFSALNQTIKRQTIRAQIRKNGTTIIPYCTSYSFTYQIADNNISHTSSSFLIQLNANDYIELMSNRQTNEGFLLLVPNENVFFIRLMRNL